MTDVTECEVPISGPAKIAILWAVLSLAVLTLLGSPDIDSSLLASLVSIFSCFMGI